MTDREKLAEGGVALRLHRLEIALECLEARIILLEEAVYRRKEKLPLKIFEDI